MRLPLFDEIFAGKFQPNLGTDSNVSLPLSIMDEDKIETVPTKDTVKTSRNKRKRLSNQAELSNEKGSKQYIYQDYLMNFTL